MAEFFVSTPIAGGFSARMMGCARESRHKVGPQAMSGTAGAAQAAMGKMIWAS
jgi:hypothetical protein